MSMLVGFHVEGWDHLILRSFVAVLLGVPVEEIVTAGLRGSHYQRDRR